MQRSDDIALRSAGDDDANPVWQTRGVARQHFDEFVASRSASFVERINNDQTPLASSANRVAQRIGEKVVKELGGILPIQLRDFRQRQQELAIVGQPGGNLKG